MAALVGSLQQYFGPVLVIGLVTGALSLIPVIGWILGLAVFVLAIKYTRRDTLLLDLAVTLAFWIAIRAIAIPLHLV